MCGQFGLCEDIWFVNVPACLYLEATHSPLVLQIFLVRSTAYFLKCSHFSLGKILGLGKKIESAVEVIGLSQERT